MARVYRLSLTLVGKDLMSGVTWPVSDPFGVGDDGHIGTFVTQEDAEDFGGNVLDVARKEYEEGVRAATYRLWKGYTPTEIAADIRRRGLRNYEEIVQGMTAEGIPAETIAHTLLQLLKK